jgi:putative transposase
MPRGSRPQLGGICSHIVTRGNARTTVFHTAEDYARFSELLRSAQQRIPMDLFGWCLMPNHVHLVLRPRADRDLGRWLHWLLTSHAQHHRTTYRTTGHIWQGRYKSFPIQADAHLLRVLRYVERNPVRAGLVASARQWDWSSLALRHSESDACVLSQSPVPLPEPWADFVDAPLTAAELEAVRTSVRTGRPLGDPPWTRGVTERLHLRNTLNPRGRPRTL